MLGEEALDGGRLERAGEQVPLAAGAARFPKAPELISSLDALRNGLQSEHSTQLHECSDQHTLIRRCRPARNEGAVDLQLVHGEPLQVRQR